MFKMLYDQNFTYDSSMPVYENKPPSWPYTLDYRIFHDCMIPPCPTNSYPGKNIGINLIKLSLEGNFFYPVHESQYKYYCNLEIIEY